MRHIFQWIIKWISILSVMSLLLLGCYNYPVLKEKTIIQRTVSPPRLAKIEGTVLNFAGGGTREQMYPGGYILVNYKWITEPPFSSKHIYLDGVIDNSLLDKNVRVVGTAREFIYPGDGRANFGISFIRITIDTLHVLK